MKLRHVYIILLFLTTLPIMAQRSDNYLPDKTNVKLTSTNLPIVFIQTDNQTIQRYNRITARMTVIDNGEGKLNYTDTLAHRDQNINYNGYIGLRYRGNSSFGADKKSYSIRTLAQPLEEGGEKQKVALMGMPKDNKWELLASFFDKSLMRNMLAYELARPWMEFTPHGRFCEMILDGTYYGVFILFESVSKGKHRLNLSTPGETEEGITGDYLLEVDRPEDNYFRSKYHPVNNSGKAFTNRYISVQYKEPEYDELTTAQRNYIRQSYNEMEDALNAIQANSENTEYREHIDVQSFIDYQLANELAHNVDGYRLSGKIYKRNESRGGQFRMTLWDFDLTYGNADYYNGWKTNTWVYANNQQMYSEGDGNLVPFWWYKLNLDTKYREELKARWTEYRQTNIKEEQIFQLIDSLSNLLTSNGAMNRNSQAWPRWGQYVWPNYYVASNFKSEITWMKQWITKRIAWMDSQLGYDEATPILADNNNDHEELRIIGYYTTDGRRTSLMGEGIYIVQYSDGTTRKIFYRLQ